jgi:hypothetical protein
VHFNRRKGLHLQSALAAGRLLGSPGGTLWTPCSVT